MQMLSGVPEGTEDLLFEKCRSKRDIERKLEGVFTAAGFNEIITPSFEYCDVFNAGRSEAYKTAYTFTDNHNALLALRTDNTAPIARVAAGKLKDCTGEQKFFYNQNVFRANQSFSGRANEIAQCGIEYIGARGIENDIYIISLAVEALKEAVGENFRLELSHADILGPVIDDLDLEEDKKTAVRLCMAQKNLPELKELLKGAAGGDVLCKLPVLFGGAEILSGARELLSILSNEKITQAVDYLENIYKRLEAEDLSRYIMFDLGFFSEFDYYTGIVFRAYTEGCGGAILSGGRYDSLLHKFGKDAPAAGFAIDVNSVLKAISGNKAAKRPLRIAVTKGRLEKDSAELFESRGIGIEELKNKGRKLIITSDDGSIELLLAKSGDVITYVEHGVCDLGIVGKDTIIESNKLFYELHELGYGRCRFALATKKDSDFYGGYNKKIIATKYPGVARSFFAAKGLDVEIIKIEGSVELAPILDLSDAIVDLVETGNTLKANGLEVIEDICDVSARIIANTAGLKLKDKQIKDFLSRIGIGISI